MKPPRYFTHHFLVGCCSPLIFLLLVGCYPKDPIDTNYTSSEPADFWEPSCTYEPEPCPNGLFPDEDVSEIIQKAHLAVYDLVDIALRNNPVTQKTWSLARAAAYNVGVARSSLYPDVNFQENYTYYDVINDDRNTRISAGGTPTGVAFGRAGSTNELDSVLSVSYLLLDFGGRDANIQAAKQSLYESNWTHNRQIQLVIFSVLQNYYTYEGYKALLEAQYADLENAKTNFQSAKEQFDLGLKTKLDVLQAQSNLVNAETSIITTLGLKTVAKGNLATSMGLDADDQFDIPEFPSDINLDGICDNLEKLIEIGIDERPDLAAVYAQREFFKEQVTIARSAGLPTLSLNAAAQEQIFIGNASFNNHTYTGSVVLNVPIFNGYLYVNEVKQAKELVRASCADIRNTKNNVVLDVFTTFYNFKTAVETYKYNLEYLRFTQETYEAALSTYREGITTILDVLIAQQNLATARAQVIQSRTQWAIALANVSLATGTLGTMCEDSIKCRDN